LASLGHKVIGLDTSPEMLARASREVPDGAFYEADLHDVPLADDSVDLVVCAIALWDARSHSVRSLTGLTRSVASAGKRLGNRDSARRSSTLATLTWRRRGRPRCVFDRS
jgi:ubiquinone/menaquinone biosynthesis C-methylase UbiE